MTLKTHSKCNGIHVFMVLDILSGAMLYTFFKTTQSRLQKAYFSSADSLLEQTIFWFISVLIVNAISHGPKRRENNHYEMELIALNVIFHLACYPL